MYINNELRLLWVSSGLQLLVDFVQLVCCNVGDVLLSLKHAASSPIDFLNSISSAVQCYKVYYIGVNCVNFYQIFTHNNVGV